MEQPIDNSLYVDLIESCLFMQKAGGLKKSDIEPRVFRAMVENKLIVQGTGEFWVLKLMALSPELLVRNLMRRFSLPDDAIITARFVVTDKIQAERCVMILSSLFDVLQITIEGSNRSLPAAVRPWSVFIYKITVAQRAQSKALLESEGVSFWQPKRAAQPVKRVNEELRLLGLPPL